MSFFDFLFNFLATRTTGFLNATQYMVYNMGLTWMDATEKEYRRQITELGGNCSDPGIFRARLFGLNFAVSTLTLTLGQEGHKKSAMVYLHLLRKASRGMKVEGSTVRQVSIEVLKEQTRALQAEKRNMGSGRYALAAIYEKALEDSLGPLSSMPHESARTVAGVSARMIDERLADWIDLYRQLSGRSAYGYDQGFEKSEQDSKRLPEDA